MAKEVVLPVEGMHCAGCENNVQFVLSSQPGVQRVKADYKGQQVEVVFDPAVTSEDAVRRAIEDIGYRVVA